MGIRILVSTQDHELLTLLRRFPEDFISIESGFSEMGDQGSLLLDFRTLKKCCVRHLLRCARHAVRKSCLGHRHTAHGTRDWRMNARSFLARRAWAERDRILMLENRPERIKRFLTLAMDQKSRAITVPEAASEVGMSVRNLNREVVRALHFPPSVVLRIARVVNVIRDIMTSGRPLATIALEHGYRDLAGMDRQFSRTVGFSPSTCREGAELSPSEMENQNG